ncbi:MAG: hypothetical protein R2794_06035 [Chitinophagales bacterium]
MKAILFFYIAALFFTVSCEKSIPLSDLQNGIIHGKVTDKTTGAPIAGASVYLKGYELGGSIFVPGPSFTVATTVSDTNGNFCIDFDYNSDYGYFCSAVADLYFDYQEEFVIDKTIFGDEVNVEITLQPVAWLNVHIKAVNEYAPSDFIGINSTPSYTFFGNVDTTQMITVEGNKNYTLVWFIYVDGFNDASESADIYCPAIDTTYFELLF